jgi:ATP-dependent DNA ligase
MNNLPMLFRRSSTGTMLQWSCWTEGNEIVIEAGQVGGKLIQHRRACEAKNIGKANETTPEIQAENEAVAEWKHKVEHKYVVGQENVGVVRKIEVMLAPNEKFIDALNPKKSTRKYAVYPADIQPKLDGARCLAYWDGDGDRIVLMTRGGKEWQAPHIKEQLAKVMPRDAMFDGEMYYHGVNRQTIQKWLSNNYEESKKLEFHIYDIPMCDGEEDRTWEQRRLDLERLVPGTAMKADPNTPQLVKVLTLEVQSEEQVLALQEQFLDAGFEGSMVRNRKGRYQSGVRSKDLLKVKLFEDDEFKIVGYTQAEGGHAGCVIWICATKEGKEFRVVPNGSLPDRQEWFRNGDSFIGQMLTVKYQGFSLDGLPQIAKGIAIRLPEDTSVARTASGEEEGF